MLEGGGEGLWKEPHIEKGFKVTFLRFDPSLSFLSPDLELMKDKNYIYCNKRITTCPKPNLNFNG